MPNTTERSSFALRGIALFASLAEPRLDALAQVCRWHVLPARHVLLTRAQDDGAVHCLVSGAVRVTTFSAGGRQITFRDCKAGEHLGDLSAIDGLPRSAEVLTLAPSVVASLARADFLALLHDEPSVALQVMQGLAGLVRSLTERVVEVSSQSVQQRLLHELLRRARALGAVDTSQVRLSPAPGHAELAAQVSTYREQVSREVAVLVRQGVVQKDGKDWVVNVAAALQHLEAGH